jgi:hypothetical protein
MRTLTLSGLALVLTATSGAALAANDSVAPAGVSFPTNVTAPPKVPMAKPGLPSVASPVVETPSAPTGRWDGGDKAPGGRSAYKRPLQGYRLPAYWTQDRFYISDYRAYGLREPGPGFGWSRYYDDAVITDSSGMVYDAIPSFEWDQRYDNDERYDGPRGHYDREHRRKGRGLGSALTGIGGAIVGGAVGAIAGNLIAGRGDRLAGSLIGGGVGALAGSAIETAASRHHSPRRGNDDRYGDYRYDGPHWGRGGGYQGYGYNSGYGYGWQGDQYITVQSVPVTTTSTRTYYETVSVPVRKRVYHRRIVRAKPRAQCVCGS